MEIPSEVAICHHELEMLTESNLVDFSFTILTRAKLKAAYPAQFFNTSTFSTKKKNHDDHQCTEHFSLLTIVQKKY